MSKPAGKSDKTNGGAPAEKVPSLIIVTEEDDEFEEFEDGNWSAQAEEKEAQIKQQWQDDWDVDDADDDFCNQLRNELQKTK